VNQRKSYFIIGEGSLTEVSSHSMRGEAPVANALANKGKRGVIVLLVGTNKKGVLT